MYKNLILNFLVCGTLERQEMLIYRNCYGYASSHIYLCIFVYARWTNIHAQKKNVFANVMVDSTKCFVLIEDALTGCFVHFF